MNKFFRWLFEIPGDPPEPEVVVAQVVARPAVVNPTPAMNREFAEWRAGHIDRWLADPDNTEHHNRDHLTAERDMHLASLRMTKEV